VKAGLPFLRMLIKQGRSKSKNLATSMSRWYMSMLSLSSVPKLILTLRSTSARRVSERE
jgi:hypothetical protein